MGLKQHTLEQPLNQRRNQKGNRKCFESQENENTTYQKLRGCSRNSIKSS